MPERPLVGLWGRIASIEPTLLQVLGATVFLVVLTIGGTIAFASTPGWTVVDGLYMTFITISTIGFQEVHPLTPFGRILTIVIGVVGIVTLGFIVTRTTQLFVAGPLTLRKKHRRRMIDRIEDHYIICGFGRLGQRIASDLHNAGKRFVIIENNDAKLERLEDTEYLHLGGNAEEDSVLQEAGIERAVGLISTLTEDSDNVFVTLLARELNPSIFILTRTNTEENARRLYRAGANKVISPYEIGADRMARVILKPYADRFLEQALQVSGLDLLIEEVKIEAGSSIEGKSLRECDFRNTYGAIVVGVVESESGEVTFNPEPNKAFSEGDVLVIIGDQRMISNVRNGSKNI